MAQLLDRALDLRGRQIGKLQRRRGQSHKASRVLLAPSGKAVIRRVHDPICQRAVFHRVPPIAVDAKRLNVDPALVHLLESFHAQRPASGVASELRIRNDWLHLVDGGVRMNVHHSDAPASYLHLAARYRTGLRSLPTPASLPAAATL